MNNTKKSNRQTLTEIKKVVNDTEKANMNTHELYQHLSKLRQKNKNTSISFRGQQATHPFLNSLTEIVLFQRKVNGKSSLRVITYIQINEYTQRLEYLKLNLKELVF